MNDKTRDRLLLSIAKVLWLMFCGQCSADDNRPESNELWDALQEGKGEYERSYDEELWQRFW